MLKTNTKHLIKNRLNLNLESNRFVSNAKDINRLKDELRSGPQLSDFIAGVVKRDDKWSDYSGKLKRQSGDNERYVHIPIHLF